MRIFSFKNCKPDKVFYISAIIALICAIICGIVLSIFVNFNIYFKEFATNYVFFIFNFKNSKLIFTHLLSELFFLYIFFLIGYFTKLKYFSIIIIFIRGLYITVYCVILFSVNAFGGITVAIFVFIPSSLISLIACCITVDMCKYFDKKYCFFVPLLISVINTLIFILLVNVIFRVVIVIV